MYKYACWTLWNKSIFCVYTYTCIYVLPLTNPTSPHTRRHFLPAVSDNSRGACVRGRVGGRRNRGIMFIYYNVHLNILLCLCLYLCLCLFYNFTVLLFSSVWPYLLISIVYHAFLFLLYYHYWYSFILLNRWYILSTLLIFVSFMSLTNR
jgi:hypothetical protein